MLGWGGGPVGGSPGWGVLSTGCGPELLGPAGPAALSAAGGGHHLLGPAVTREQALERLAGPLLGASDGSGTKLAASGTSLGQEPVSAQQRPGAHPHPSPEHRAPGRVVRLKWGTWTGAEAEPAWGRATSQGGSLEGVPQAGWFRGPALRVGRVVLAPHGRCEERCALALGGGGGVGARSVCSFCLALPGAAPAPAWQPFPRRA